ncbi:MAG: hypothetical protein QOC62_359 [Mycobacterium sp.]|jgi:hypothetical protein|nr:hypothetical protein [Mycobacterium sp.]
MIVDDPGKSDQLVPTHDIGDGPVGVARFPRGVATEIGTWHALWMMYHPFVGSVADSTGSRNAGRTSATSLWRMPAIGCAPL